MSDYIRLPRSALSEDLWRDGNLARLLVYLLTKADDNGEIHSDLAAIARDLILSRQNVRTLMKKIESNQILTKSSTTRLTKLKLSIQEDKPKRQPRRQPNRQPNPNQIKTLIPDYISPPFVAEEYREIWQAYMEFRKNEIKKPYKSEATERVAYNKMVELSHNDPAVARDMVERAMTGKWQGLYETDSNGKRTCYPTNRVNRPLSDEEKLADYADLARAISERAKTGGNI